MIYNEEQAARDRSEVLAYQYPDAIDPLKALVRKQINDELERKRKERGGTLSEFICVLLAICTAALILGFASEIGSFFSRFFMEHALL